MMMLFLLGCTAELTEDAALPYDFSQQSQAYLEYIGVNFNNRNVVADGESPDENNTHEATVNWILSELKNAGYTDEQITCVTENGQGDLGDTYPVQNIIVTVIGADASKQIIVGAHYDGDGIGDNGSGVALLLATICGLVNEQPQCTVKYVFFDAEEVGLVGARVYAESMTDAEIASTLFMVNIDAISFGDYPNIYGGFQDEETGEVTQMEAYDLACAKAEALGFTVYTTSDLDGYYAANGTGPAIEEKALYTNPWTVANPAPANDCVYSPTTGDWSDHTDFKYLGIPYIYFEATNWYTTGDGGTDAYTGYFETANTTMGYDGMFMNTEFDTLDNLNSFFPGRSLSHFEVYSPLLSSLILNPLTAE